MTKFRATLTRERFVLRNKKKKDEEPQIALGNRLELYCFDAKEENSATFIVRAQNIHTTLRIAARLARHWYDHGEIVKEGKHRFSWAHEYKEATKDFEDKWNPDCWACIYKNGKLLFGAEPAEKTQLFDIIEKVYAYEKGDYKDIAASAEKMFEKAGKKISIEYDGDVALRLEGSDKEVANKIIYRDSSGRNDMNLLMRQKKPKYVKGDDGAPIKLSECLTVSAVIFEGYQLGFIAGHTSFQISSGQVAIGDHKAQKADHALKRIFRLQDSLNELTQKHHLAFQPKPSFQNNIRKIEESFRAMSRNSK